jgi:hypothetical protein
MKEGWAGYYTYFTIYIDKRLKKIMLRKEMMHVIELVFTSAKNKMAASRMISLHIIFVTFSLNVFSAIQELTVSIVKLVFFSKYDFL